MINELIKYTLDEARAGSYSHLGINDIIVINKHVKALLENNKHSQEDINNVKSILEVSNILYNNTDRNILLLEDGIYDLLLEMYKVYDPGYQVGAQPVYFKSSSNISTKTKSQMIRFVDKEKIEDMLYGDKLFENDKLTRTDILKSPISFRNDVTLSKRTINTKHNYPKLVGSLDKCKFVLSAQAKEKGVFDDNNVKILERDFFKKHIDSGILDPRREFYIVAELKYDGVSVEADILNEIEGARSRGDANADIATDLTPILKGYRFKDAPIIQEEFGMKFEAIMTHNNLAKYNVLKQKDYKNCRTAISGLFSSSDAPKYRDFITLVPLATSLDNIDRLTEIEFMNKYYTSGERLRYSVLHGNYIDILFQIKMFVEEAEYLRPYMPFMYDGVVISYIEPDLIDALGRSNSINKYSTAIKFNPVRKQSLFIGYDYTVGKDGCITPMIHYTPVEFYGTTHDHSSGHSYDRFKTLSLRKGDMLDIDYVNDVMPYVSKPNNSHNINNIEPLEEFITECPSCGTAIEISKSGKSAYCMNMSCKQRNIARIVSMMDKLNIKDFSDAYLEKIDKYTLSDMMNLSVEEISFLGELTSKKFIELMNELKSKPIYDFNIIGSLGFDNIGQTKWKLILNKYTLNNIISFSDEELREKLVSIKGIGPTAVNTIINEFDFFRNDIETISKMKNIIITKGMKFGKNIRFTGCRDEALVQLLNDLGNDASGKAGVTKDTDILIVPIEGHQSAKIDKLSDGAIIVGIDDFKNNMDKYL